MRGNLGSSLFVETVLMYIGGFLRALCGAICVEEIIKFLKKKFAEVLPSIPWDLMDTSDLKELMETWKPVRNGFTEEDSENWIFRLPDSLLEPGRHTGGRPQIVITPQDVKCVFQPSIERIVKMVGDQISAINEIQGKQAKVSFSRLSLS